MEVTVVAPLLLPEGPDQQGCQGFIEACGRQWAIRLYVPPDATHRDAVCVGDVGGQESFCVAGWILGVCMCVCVCVCVWVR